MMRILFALFISALSLSVLAQDEEKTNKTTQFGLFVSQSSPGEDLKGLDSGQTAGIHFRLNRGPVFSMLLELESSLNYGSDVQTYAINFIPTWKVAPHLKLMLGGGMGKVDARYSEEGLNLLAGFSVPLGKHVELFARYDYLFALESGDKQVYFNNHTFKASAAKAGVAFYF